MSIWDPKVHQWGPDRPLTPLKFGRTHDYSKQYSDYIGDNYEGNSFRPYRHKNDRAYHRMLYAFSHDRSLQQDDRLNPQEWTSPGGDYSRDVPSDHQKQKTVRRRKEEAEQRALRLKEQADQIANDIKFALALDCELNEDVHPAYEQKRIEQERFAQEQEAKKEAEKKKAEADKKENAKREKAAKAAAEKEEKASKKAARDQASKDRKKTKRHEKAKGRISRPIATNNPLHQADGQLRGDLIELTSSPGKKCIVQ